VASKLVTVEELIRIVPVSKHTVYREVERAMAILKVSPKAKGLIPFKRFGRKIFFEVDKVLEWMEPLADSGRAVSSSARSAKWNRDGRGKPSTRKLTRLPSGGAGKQRPYRMDKEVER